MTKTVLGYITMNAGDGIPGSILKWALQNYAHRFDYSVVVDGNLTESAKAFYSGIPNLRVVDSPWKGRHVDQYYKRNSVVEDGDWILALDDDEFPSENLMSVVSNIDKVISQLPQLNIVYIPSLTYLAVDSSNNFWRVQESPSQEDYLRRSKRIFYRKSSKHNYFIHSPCGMHVTPTQVDSIYSPSPKMIEAPIGDHRCFFYHMKTIESFIYNECVYNVSNPIHESGPGARLLTQEEEQEFNRLVVKYDLKNIPKFLEMTKASAWPDDFRDFVFQFKHHLGQAMSKFYYLYEYVSKGIKQEDVIQLINCISTGFIPVYNTVKSTNERPIVIPRTPNIWQ